MVIKLLKKALDVNLAFFSSPLTTITKGVKAGLEKTEKKSALERTVDIALTAGTLAAPLTGAGRTVIGKVGSTVVKAFKAKPLLTTAAVFTAPAVVTYAKEKPVETVKAPVKIIEAGADLGELLADPSVEKAKEYVKEHPITTIIGGIIVGAGVAKTAAPIIGGVLTQQAIEESAETQAKALEGIAQKPVVTYTVDQPSNLISTSEGATGQGQVLIPKNETLPILSSDVKKKRRSYRKKEPQQIKISNRNINKLVYIGR